MRITCQRENLARELGVVSRAASRSAAMPILGNVLLSAQIGQMKLSATNLERDVTVQVPGATVHEAGEITAPAQLLADLIKSLPGDEVVLECHNGALAVSCDRFDTNVKGIEADQFPVVDVEGQPVARVA